MKRFLMIAVGSFFIFFIACTKLDEKLYSSIKAETYYTNKNEVLSAVLRPYTHTNAWATSTDNRSWWKVSELSADQTAWPIKGVDGIDGGVWGRLHRHGWSSNDEISRSPWELMWTGIGYCNSAIINLEAKDAASMGITESDKTAYIAELNLLRDFYYIRTMDLYGNIPYVTDLTTEHPPTLARKAVYDSIEVNIKKYIGEIPNMSTANVGRLSKAGAYAMLVELYLNGQVWSGTDRYADCVAACDTILNGNVGSIGKTLTLDSTVLQTYQPSNRTTSQEQIFSIVYNYQTANWSPGWASNFYHFRQRYVYNGTENGNNGIVLVPGVYTTYDDQDVRKKEWFYIGPMWYYNDSTKMDNADFKRPITGIREYSGKQIVFVDAIKRYSELKANATSADSANLPSDMTTGEENSGVRLNKYRLGTSADPNYRSTSWIIYRLTQIYFAKAEALMRLNGGNPTQEAVDLINACRKRDFSSSVWESKKFTVANFNMDSLLAERGREFIIEGYRRQDLIRFGKFVTASWWDHVPSQDKNKELFPIPIEQMALNPNLVQNPGY